MNKEDFKLRIIEQLKTDTRFNYLFLNKYLHKQNPEDRYLKRKLFTHMGLGCIMDFEFSGFSENKTKYQVKFWDIPKEAVDFYQEFEDISSSKFYRVCFFEEVYWQENTLVFSIEKYGLCFTDDCYLSMMQKDEMCQIRWDVSTGIVRHMDAGFKVRNTSEYYLDFDWSDNFWADCLLRTRTIKPNKAADNLAEFVKWASQMKSDSQQSQFEKIINQLNLTQTENNL